MNARGNRGFILVAVLWMLAALAALASAYSMFAINTAASAYLPQQRLVVDAAIRAAVELTAYRQLAWSNGSRPSRGGFSTKIGATLIKVDYRAESARIDLNGAPRGVLAGLFNQLGAKSSTADFLASRIVAWRRRQQDSDQRTEAAIYHNAGLAYAPVGAPFDNVLELAALPQMSPQLLARALPYLTVYNNSGVVDPTIADPIVLAAVPGLTPQLLSELKAAAGKPSDALALPPSAQALMNMVGVGSNDTVRAQVLVRIGERTVAAEVVIEVIVAGDEPYQILYWRDDFDD